MNETLAYQILGGLATLAASWGGVRVMVAELRDRVSKHETSIQDVRLKVATLEAQHDGLGHRLDEALGKLEQVTQDLQRVALEIARSSR